MSHRIDVHHHILPAHYVEQIGAARIGAQGSSGRMPAWSVGDALARMDAHGVATAITSVTSPGLALDDAGRRASLARWCNEFAAGLCADHPGRFGMFATLPLPDVDATLAEIEFAYSSCPSDGVCVMTNYSGTYFDHTRYRPVFAELDRRAAVVFVHPTMTPSMTLVGGLSASTLEFTFDTARCIAAVVFGGILRDFPRIRFVFSHAGGAMPYLAGRFDTLLRNNPGLRELIPGGMAAELRKMYFDTALSVNRVTFASLLAVVPPENILFGTDYPFGPRDQIEDAVKSMATLDLTADARLAIERGNALRLFERRAGATSPGEALPTRC